MGQCVEQWARALRLELQWCYYFCSGGGCPAGRCAEVKVSHALLHYIHSTHITLHFHSLTLRITSASQWTVTHLLVMTFLNLNFINAYALSREMSCACLFDSSLFNRLSPPNVIIYKQCQSPIQISSTLM